MHQEQLKSAQEWVKNTSHSCSTVVVLVATVVFAAAYTTPGGVHEMEWNGSRWTPHPPGKTSVLVFHGDGRSGADELLDVGGNLPLHPHFIDGLPRFSQHRASGSLAGLHIPLLLCDVDDADIHGHDSPAGSSAEKMDCNMNVCGYVPSNRVFALFQFLCITGSSLRIEEIKIKACSFQHISFHHVDRQANRVAHMIAKEGFSLSEDRFWVEELPEAAKVFLARDLWGMTSQI